MSDQNETIKKRKRQAVVIIHGIGEQYPMETLNSFIDAVWTSDASQIADENYGPTVYNKPDHVSGNHELRRLTTNTNDSDYITEFFELYWADIMEDNRLEHFLGWLMKIVFIRRLPPILNWYRWILIIVMMLVGFLVYQIAMMLSNDPLISQVITGLFTFIIIPFFTYSLTHIGGDAARYLDASPKNVKRRQEIRNRGIALLKKLHRKKSFDRIIVVGHSLGSVIAYDILTIAFSSFTKPVPKGTRFPAIKALSTFIEDIQKIEKANKEGSTKWTEYHKLQKAAFEEQKAGGFDWLVSDLITLGSPLTYAEYLMSKDAENHQKKIDSKILPTCPPKIDRDKIFKIRDAKSLHFASLFAFTRWTNIYFPSRALIFGDPISGPLAKVFGKGIKDVKSRFKTGTGIFTHTMYWQLSDNNDHIAELRKAINLLDK